MRSRWERVIQWVLIAGTVLALAGGGAAAKTLTIAPGWGSIPDQLSFAMKSYTEKTGVTFEVMTPPGNYHEQLLVWMAAGTMPDLFMVQSSNLADFARVNAMLPLDAYYARDVDESLYLPMFGASTVNGVRYGFPAEGGGYRIGGTWINVNAFLEAGLAVPGPRIEDAMTYEEIAEAAARLTIDSDGDGAPERYGLSADPGLWTMRVLLPTNGASFFNADGTEVLLDRPEAIEVFAWLQELKQRGIFVTAGNNQFPTGQSAMDIRWRAIASVWPDVIGDSFEWRAAPVPAGRAGSVGVINMNSLAISATTPQAEEAWRFILHVMSEDVQEEWAARGFATSLRSTALKYVTVPHPPYDFTPFLEGEAVPMNAGLLPPPGVIWPNEATTLLNRVINGDIAPEIGVQQAADLLRVALRERDAR